MNAFFYGYVNSKTTLKQFVEQYDNALTLAAGVSVFCWFFLAFWPAFYCFRLGVSGISEPSVIFVPAREFCCASCTLSS